MKARLRTHYRQLSVMFGVGTIDDVSLIGLDVAREPSRLRSHGLAPVLAILLAGALVVVALRVDLIRMRYAKGSALAEERSLLDIQRELLVEKQQLRDPARLSVEARKLGFRRPERIIDWSVAAVAATSPEGVTSTEAHRP
jgi:hypothetical protein